MKTFVRYLLAPIWIPLGLIAFALMTCVVFAGAAWAWLWTDTYTWQRAWLESKEYLS